MKFYSPLRYPGGKNRLSQFLASVCELNRIDGHYIEPYAGGASVALYLLIEGYVREVTINDYDRSIYAFWYSAINKTEQLCSKIENTNIDSDTWIKQRKIQDNKDEEMDLLKLGFSTFFLNRTNYSGIINGGMIGGTQQKGKYKIDCRFNKKELINRIRIIAKHKKHIHLKNMDALDLIKNLAIAEDTIFYFDPPYYLKGPSLYMNHYNHGDHEAVSKEIKNIKNAQWIVSYDNTPEITKMYDGCNMKKYEFFHTAYKAKMGKEILFSSDNLVLPTNIISAE